MEIFTKIYEAYSYGEALKKATSDGFRIMGNKTVDWKRSGVPLQGKKWNEYVETLFTNYGFVGIPGVGFLITITPGIKGRRKRPYDIEFFSHGQRKYISVYQIYDLETDQVIATLPHMKNKRKAITALKKQTVALKRNLGLRTAKVTNNPIDAICYYKYGAESVLGQYIYFGNPIVEKI